MRSQEQLPQSSALQHVQSHSFTRTACTSVVQGRNAGMSRTAGQ